MATEAASFPKDNKEGAVASENRADIPIQKGLESSEITEELPSGQHGTRENLLLEVPTRTLEEAREDFVRINMPLTPPSRRVIFSPCLSPGFSRSNESPGPSSSKNKSTIKTLLPKLNFKIRNTSSEIEKAAFLALEGSPTVAPKKPLISRTLSFTKVFTSRGKQTSSLPVTPIAHSNSGSEHGGNTAYPATSIEKGMQLPIHRSHSVPVLTKEGNTPVGGMFRMVPTTPRLAEKIAATTSMRSPPDDTGFKYGIWCHCDVSPIFLYTRSSCKHDNYNNAILLATFTGFGAVMCGASILTENLKWRRWHAQLNQQHGSQEAVLPDQSSAAAHQDQTDSQHPESNLGGSPVHAS